MRPEGRERARSSRGGAATPSSPAMGLGERCKLPQRGPGRRSPGKNCILDAPRAQKHVLRRQMTCQSQILGGRLSPPVAVASSAPLATPMNKNVFVRSAICTTLSSVRLCVRRSVTLCTVVKRCILQNEWEVPSKNTLSLKHTVNQRTDKIVHVWNSHRQHAVYERFSQAISALLLIFCHFLTFIPLMTFRVFWHLRQNHLRQRSPTEASISGINGVHQYH